jgi:hypothetical protein
VDHRAAVRWERLSKFITPMKDEVTGEWSKLHNVELSDLYSSPTIIRVFTPRRLRWAGHVTRMGRGAMHAGFWWV